MKKILKSGEVCMGICGEPAGFTDSFGSPLYVGDLVNVYMERPDKRKAIRESSGPEYIVHMDNEDPFIMGLKSSMNPVTHYYLDGDESNEDDYDYRETHYINKDFPEDDPRYLWLVAKIKDHKDTVHGERWGSGNVTTYLVDEDEKKEEDGVKEVF